MNGRWPRASHDVMGNRVRFPLDPDPRHVPETIEQSADYLEGWDVGFAVAEREYRPTIVTQATQFGLGIVVGMALAIVLFLSAVTEGAR